MKTSKTTCAVLVGLALVIGAVVIVILVTTGALNQLLADPSSAFITSPANNDILFLGDAVYVDVSALLAHRNFGGMDLYVDGQKYALDAPLQSYSPKNEVQCASSDPRFCGQADLKQLWVPTQPGAHSLSACLRPSMEAPGFPWKICTDAVRVVVAEAGASSQIAGTYASQAGDTLASVAQKFGLPPLLLVGANPKVDPSRGLPNDTPVNIPSDPSRVPLNSGSNSANSPWVIDQARMSVTVPIDKGYCYYSLGQNYWTRMPAGPQTFSYPVSGQLDLTDEFRSVTISPAGGSLQLECWGWSGTTLIPLGSGKTTLTPSPSAHIKLQGDQFSLDATLGSIPGVFQPMKKTLIISPPSELTNTNDLNECINHFPDGIMRGFFGPLLCKSAIELHNNILVWEWSAPIFPPDDPKFTYATAIDGYHLYKVYVGGKPALVKTIPDPGQKIFIVPDELPGSPIPTYFVRAYLGPLESANSNLYTLAPATSGLATVSLPALSNSVQPLSYAVSSTNKESDDCSTGSAPGLAGAALVGLGSDEIVVGYEHDIFDCVKMNDWYYRGSVVFDLTKIAGPISKAVLTFQQGNTVVTDPGFYGVDGESCAASLNIATGLSGGTISSFDPYRDLGLSGYKGMVHSVDVTEAVRGWMLGTANDGFILTGRDEGSPTETKDCWSRYRLFNLTATYFTTTK